MESPERSPRKGGHGGGAGEAVADAATDSRSMKKERFLDFLKATPSKEWLHRFGFTARLTPYAFLRRVASLRTRSAKFPAAAPPARRRFSFFLRAPAFARTVDWPALRARCIAWARHPMNAALLVWVGFVAAGVVFVFLLMTGALNSAVPDASRRRRWTEVANQMLNALFTIMCVYQHPQLCHHLTLLLRWRAADVAELRAVYCKNGGAASLRLHVAVVVLLLHATCLAQYGYCALFWLFRADARPDWAVNLCMALGLGAPVAAGLYMVYGPLGRKIMLPVAPGDEEAAAPVEDEASANTDSLKERYNGGSCRVVVTSPEWAGGLLDLADDPTVAALSLSCTFCVFGWNMERLGMGNMYVHVFTFALLCAAPVLVFAVAALNIRDGALGSAVGAAGALLSVLGLAYGGFWRAQMRRRFGLPADQATCWGRPAAADYAKWLLCAPCALAQEVRTANFYDVEADALYARDSGGAQEEKPAMAPLEREGCAGAVDAPPPPVRMQVVWCTTVDSC